MKVADRTGMVNLSLWNEPGKVLQSGQYNNNIKVNTNLFDLLKKLAFPFEPEN